MKSQVLHTVWCNISGEAAGEIWYWSLLVMKGLKRKCVSDAVRIGSVIIFHLSKLWNCQVLHTAWSSISGEAAEEIWNWSLLGVKGSILLWLSQQTKLIVPAYNVCLLTTGGSRNDANGEAISEDVSLSRSNAVDYTYNTPFTTPPVFSSPALKPPSKVYISECLQA